MKLLIEHVEEVNYLTEEVEGKKHLHIEGIYLQSELKNRNGRVYPKTILEREANRYIREKVEGRCAWGELGHPDTPTINLDRTCMRILNLREDGNNWIGKSMILDNNMGAIVRSLIESGGRIGVSSRGVGTLKMVEGSNMVQDDFHLATAADVVADPSAPDAYVQGLMEGREWVWNNGIIKEADVHQMHQEIKRASKQDLEAAALKVFESFIRKI
jgi:hypothetical protein